MLKVAICCREGDPFQGPRGVLVSDLEMNYPRRCVCQQSERLYWEGRPGQRAAGEGAQEDCSATWLTVLGFMVMGLVSGLSLASHSDAESFLVVHALLSQDGR